MENEKKSRAITRSDIDAQGNVTLWDHGPTSNAEPGTPEYEQAQDEAEKWYEDNGKGPVAITIELSAARHAIEADPVRYSLDVNVDDPEIAAEVDKIQQKRAADKKAAEEAEAAQQLATDWKSAAIAVQAKRHTEALAAKQKAIDAATAAAAAAGQKAIAAKKRVLPKSQQPAEEPQPEQVGVGKE